MTVEVSNNGQDWSAGGLGLLAWEDVPRTSGGVVIEPSMGPSRGGSQVVVRLLGLDSHLGISLQVGQEGSAQCRYLGGVEYSCEMPAVRSVINRVLPRYTVQVHAVVEGRADWSQGS
eukprot:657789-Hanusia_phi.AAC.1